MFKTIEKYPKYAVNEKGVVINAKSGKHIAIQTYLDYKCVLLWKDGAGKWFKVHRLVAEAFIPNPLNLPFINHKDLDKGNNEVSNLEWCNATYNNTYGEKSPVICMKIARSKEVGQYNKNGELIAVYQSATEAQRATGIKQSNISKCCLGRKTFLTAGGYIWKFTNQNKIIER